MAHLLHARTRRAELLWAGATVAATCVLAAIALKLWNADLRVPFNYNGDSNQNQLFVKGILDHGWYQHNADLGAPFGQVLYDFPVLSGDNLQALLIKVIGLFSSDSALVMNLFFLLTFPLTAAIAYAVLRALDVSRGAAGVTATLYALAPYHFLRGEYHLWIGAYYAVPLSAYLIVTVLRGSARIPRGRALLGIVLLAAVIGSAHVYYAAFAILLLAVAILLRLIGGGREAALAGVVFALLIGVATGLNHLPNAIYRAQHGTNTSLERPAIESEDYGLKLDQMLLPVPGHRLPPLRHLRERYSSAAGNQLREGDTQALGLIGAIGLVGLIAVALLAPLARRRLEDDDRLPALATATLAAVVIATVGGLSGVFAFVVSSQLRAWARMSIFIEFFALAAVALAADHLALRRGARAGAIALAVVLVAGFLDQTNGTSEPEYQGTAAAYKSDAALVRAVEQRLPSGASVFELPYEPFPEPQPAFAPPGLGPYGMARPYLHSHDLRWSYGLMKGRAGDWQWAAVQLPPAQLARGLAAAGFSGIYIDRGGYVDGATHLVRALTDAVGTAPLSSPDGRLAFFDLRA